MTIPNETDVLVVGGGPAGALLGCLLARRGIDVVVAEKQSHLDREFRGETLAAPSVVTLRKLGFGPSLSAHGYLETTAVTMRMEGRRVFSLDYGRFGVPALPTDIPQPALIKIFNDAAAGLPGHTYVPGAACIGLLRDGNAIRGAVLRTKDGERVEVRARLVVGADGRFSKVRKEAGIAARIHPADRDFLSFKLPRPVGWGTEAKLIVERNKHLVVLPTYPDFLRIGHNLPKRGMGELRKEGFDAFRAGIAAIEPRLKPLLDEHLRSWDDTGFLEIFTAEVDEWTRDGLVLIGDASHTCTPILGQGVNLAIQDTVCVTPFIARALRRGKGNSTVRATELAEFVDVRRQHKALVTRFQRRQEAALAQNTRLGTTLRRAKFQALDRLPAKYGLFGKVLSAPHPVDPADLRTPEPQGSAAA